MSGESLAPLIRAMGRGPSRGRHLTIDEAKAGMAACLSGAAAPEAVGAFLMLMRFRGENADEVAGLAEALRGRSAPWADCGATLDWPAYAAGRSRGLPLFLLAAKLVARAGRRVFIHGWNSFPGDGAGLEQGAEAVGVPVIREASDAPGALAASGVICVPLMAIDPGAMRVLRLRDVLGLRSPINTALRAANPSRAPATVQGVFHPSYRALQSEAAERLGQQAIGVLKGGGGEFERHPGKTVELYGYRPAGAFDHKMPATEAMAPRRMKDETALDFSRLGRLWSGEEQDDFAREVIIATAGAALHVSGEAPLADCEAEARRLWEER